MRSRFVYVIEDADEGVCKIGISFDPKKRAYALGNGLRIRLTIAVGEKADRVERWAHGALEEYSIGHEWFDVSASGAMWAVLHSIKHADVRGRRPFMEDEPATLPFAEELCPWGPVR